jgi:hypothetical protein
MTWCCVTWYHYLTPYLSLSVLKGPNCRRSYPVHTAAGRVILLSMRCSKKCYAQPLVRAITKIGVNIPVGTPILW